MGYSLSWAGVRHGSAETVQSILGLKPTEKREEIPESKIVACVLPTGRYLVLFNRKEIGDKVLKQLSQLGETVDCFVEDHVLFRRASAWRKGEFVLCVSNRGAKALTV